jgi:cytosine/adenosine deaminase-related metal-dependent hydrolase
VSSNSLCFWKKPADFVPLSLAHSVHSPQLGEGWPGGVPNILKSMGLLDETILISHQNRSTKEEVELIRAAGAHISSTPSTELQMGHGRPVLFDTAFLDGGVDGNTVGAQDIASLGIDCHSNNASSIIEQARLGLQNARSLLHEYHLRDGKTVRKLPESLSVEAAFNLATVKGAEAVRMADQIGKIQEGFKADLVVFDALSPSMLAAAQHDPVAAIILHSSPADIETVIVDGVIRKKDGRLLPVTVDEAASSAVRKESLGWNDIAKQVVKSREKMQKDIDKIDWDEATKTLASVFHVPDSCFAD